MKTAAIGCALLLLGTNAGPVEDILNSAGPIFARWEVFKQRFARTYASKDHHDRAMDVFQANDKFIQSQNSNNNSYVLGHNEYSDLTPEEFGQRLGLLQLPVPTPMFLSSPSDSYEMLGSSSKDWAAEGAVTPVKNQGTCGGCWSFSVTGALEGAFKIAGNPLTSFSEEQLLNCDTNDMGCNGGAQPYAFDFIQQSGGLCTEEAYPFTEVNTPEGGPKGPTGVCKKGSCQKMVTLDGYRGIRPGDENDLLSATSKQPVSVAIDASALQFYRGGVYDGNGCSGQVNHAVLVVGYGTDEVEGKDYWKLKNSWSAGWGEDGFFRFIRGRDQCSITRQAFYPTGVHGV